MTRVCRRKSKYSSKRSRKICYNRRSSRRRSRPERRYRRRYSRRSSRRRYSRRRSCGKRDMSTCRYVTDVYGNQRGLCYKPCLSRKGKAYNAPVYTKKSVMDKYLERYNALQKLSNPNYVTQNYATVPSKSVSKPLPSLWTAPASVSSF